LQRLEQNRHIHDALIERCRKGERSAQAEVYRLYSKAMFNLSMRILQHREEAEDVLQESFLDAFLRIQTYRGESTFGAWLKRIVVNRSINQAKRKKLVFADLSGSAEMILEEDEQESPMPECSVDDVRTAVSALPDGFRIVFTLYMFEDWSHKQIADELGISESTSKSQLNRAKKKLSELLIASKQ
jgi:RNA polymerase sigma factor (sigma-70 family)